MSMIDIRDQELEIRFQRDGAKTITVAGQDIAGEVRQVALRADARSAVVGVTIAGSDTEVQVDVDVVQVLARVRLSAAGARVLGALVNDSSEVPE